MKIVKLTIPYKGNEKIRLPHLFQILVGNKVIDMNDIPSYVSNFRAQKSIFFEFSVDKIEQIEIGVQSLVSKYSLDIVD